MPAGPAKLARFADTPQAPVLARLGLAHRPPRLVRDPHGLIIREIDPEPPRDLLRTPRRCPPPIRPSVTATRPAHLGPFTIRAGERPLEPRAISVHSLHEPAHRSRHRARSSASRPSGGSDYELRRCGATPAKSSTRNDQGDDRSARLGIPYDNALAESVIRTVSVQDRTHPQTRSVEGPRPSRVRHPRIRRLVQPPAASRTHRRHPTSRKGGQLPSTTGTSPASWTQLKHSPANPVRFIGGKSVGPRQARAR